MPRILFVSGFHPATRARDLAYEFERCALCSSDGSVNRSAPSQVWTPRPVRCSGSPKPSCDPQPVSSVCILGSLLFLCQSMCKSLRGPIVSNRILRFVRRLRLELQSRRTTACPPSTAFHFVYLPLTLLLLAPDFMTHERTRALNDPNHLAVMHSSNSKARATPRTPTTTCALFITSHYFFRASLTTTFLCRHGRYFEGSRLSIQVRPFDAFVSISSGV